MIGSRHNGAEGMLKAFDIVLFVCQLAAQPSQVGTQGGDRRWSAAVFGM